MDLGLRGKVALVAGSSQGLGRAIAEELAAEGASLVLVARGRERLEAAQEAIAAAAGTPVVAVAGDVARPADRSAAVDAAVKAFSRIDILVTNSGGPPAGSFDAHGPEAWEAATQLLLTSAVELARAVLPGMRQRRWGRIVNVTSVAAKQPLDDLILSNALRAAVIGMARTLANEVAADGITVNNVLPGFTRTERLTELAETRAARQGRTRDDVLADMAAAAPARRLGEPKELAALVAFLASERAAYVTGQSVAVDGGYVRALL